MPRKWQRGISEYDDAFRDPKVYGHDPNVPDYCPHMNENVLRALQSGNGETHYQEQYIDYSGWVRRPQRAKAPPNTLRLSAPMEWLLPEDCQSEEEKNVKEGENRTYNAMQTTYCADYTPKGDGERCPRLVVESSLSLADHLPVEEGQYAVSVTRSVYRAPQTPVPDMPCGVCRQFPCPDLHPADSPKDVPKISLRMVRFHPDVASVGEGNNINLDNIGHVNSFPVGNEVLHNEGRAKDRSSSLPERGCSNGEQTGQDDKQRSTQDFLSSSKISYDIHDAFKGARRQGLTGESEQMTSDGNKAGKLVRGTVLSNCYSDEKYSNGNTINKFTHESNPQQNESIGSDQELSEKHVREEEIQNMSETACAVSEAVSNEGCNYTVEAGFRRYYYGNPAANGGKGNCGVPGDQGLPEGDNAGISGNIRPGNPPEPGKENNERTKRKSCCGQSYQKECDCEGFSFACTTIPHSRDE